MQAGDRVVEVQIPVAEIAVAEKRMDHQRNEKGQQGITQGRK